MRFALHYTAAAVLQEKNGSGNFLTADQRRINGIVFVRMSLSICTHVSDDPCASDCTVPECELTDWWSVLDETFVPAMRVFQLT